MADIIASGMANNADVKATLANTRIDNLPNGVNYKGEVDYYSLLPSSATIGDMYSVKYSGTSGTTVDGSEYIWGLASGTNQWIKVGTDTYTKAETDALIDEVNDDLEEHASNTSMHVGTEMIFDTNNYAFNATEIKYEASNVKAKLDSLSTSDGIIFNGTTTVEDELNNKTNKTELISDLMEQSETSQAEHVTPEFVSTVPASSSAAGHKGQMVLDSSYLYICIDTNSWVRVAVATF